MSEDVGLPVVEMHGYLPDEMKAALAKFEQEQEQRRLEREVIKTAKAWRQAELAELNSSRDLINAVDKLTVFENV